VRKIEPQFRAESGPVAALEWCAGHHSGMILISQMRTSEIANEV
jgi:hypothetical protein